jgi:hypothetical protein
MVTKMLIKYGFEVERHITPDVNSWLTNTANLGGGAGQNRSVSLQDLDDSLRNFNNNPTLDTFKQIESTYKRFNETQSPRIHPPPNVNVSLRADLERHRLFLDGRDIVKRRVELCLASLSWKEKAICAELYKPQSDSSWAPLTENDMLALECEANASSRWANIPPRSIAGWAEVGAKEADALQKWPEIGLAARTAIQSRELGPWPPWRGRIPFVRKGMFCHSAAAISAEYLFKHRKMLVHGTQFCIHSIAAAHQQAASAGDITHWYIIVNSPESIEHDGKSSRLHRCSDYRVLEALGGFVVDIWGALWLDQGLDGQSYATNDTQTSCGCVFTIPKEILLGDTSIRIHARQTWRE